MYLVAYGFVLALGLAMNWQDRRMLALTAMVGASVFFPVPRDTAELFYTFCIVTDISIGLLAWRFGGIAGALIADICVLLVISHLMGYSLDGSLPLSPYRVIVKILEISQLTVCVALSPVLAPILRNQDATTT